MSYICDLCKKQEGLMAELREKLAQAEGALEHESIQLMEALKQKVRAEKERDLLVAKNPSLTIIRLVAERDEARAQEAFMRREVGDAEFVVRGGDKDMALRILRDAIASNAGREFLERWEKAEKLSASVTAMERHMGQLHRCSIECPVLRVVFQAGADYDDWCKSKEPKA